MKKSVIILASVLHIALFLYAAISKIIDYDNFKFGISESPFINAYADFLAWAVPALELGIVLLLTWPPTRLAGLWASFALMLVFTIYISAMLLFASEIPCSCGGVLEKMSWPVHIVFNSVFVLLAATAILFKRKKSILDKQRVNTYAKGHTTAVEPHRLPDPY